MPWHKVKSAAKYCDVSASTMRSWIRDGNLRHIKLPTGHIRIRESWLDEFLCSFEVVPDVNTDRVAEKILDDLKK